MVTVFSRHGLPILKDQIFVSLSGTSFGDKAYCDPTTKRMLDAQGTALCTPEKKEKRQTVYNFGPSGLWSHFASAIRQLIESFFNWILEKTDIRMLSKFVPVKDYSYTATVSCSEACGGDDSLRLEVEKLLAADDEA